MLRRSLPPAAEAEKGAAMYFIGIDLGTSACKLLLVDENANADLAVSVKQAKKDGLIDNFIYASVSPSYLAAVLDTL